LESRKRHLFKIIFLRSLNLFKGDRKMKRGKKKGRVKKGLFIFMATRNRGGKREDYPGSRYEFLGKT